MRAGQEGATRILGPQKTNRRGIVIAGAREGHGGAVAVRQEAGVGDDGADGGAAVAVAGQVAQGGGRGLVENKHSTDVVSTSRVIASV
jgi:hypothetical protein